MERQPLTLPAGLCLDRGTALQDAETLLGWATLAVAANAALYLRAPGIQGMKPTMDYAAMIQDAAELACRMQEAAFLLVDFDGKDEAIGGTE